jgi:hypothetical protein
MLFVALTIVAILVVVFGMSNTVTRPETPKEPVVTPTGPPAAEPSPSNGDNTPPTRPDTPEAVTDNAHPPTPATGPPPLGIILAMALLAFIAALVLMWFGWNEGM